MFQTVFTLYSWLLDCINQENGLFLAVFSVATLAISLWSIRKPNKANIAPLPPGPCGLPIVGYLPFLGTDLHLVFTQLARVYGPIFKFWLGNKLCAVIVEVTTSNFGWISSRSPWLAKEVVRDHDITFSERDPIITSQIASFGCNDIAFDSYSKPRWKKKRKILASEMLTNSTLNGFYGLRRQQMMKTIREVYKNVGRPINIGELSFVTSVNAVMSMVWGGKLGGAAATIDGHFLEFSSDLMMLLGKPNISDIFPVLARFDLQGVARDMETIKDKVNQLFESVIELRMKMSNDKEKVDERSEEKLDFLQLLLELKDADNESYITMNELKGLLMDIVVGGTDTTSTMVEWTMAELIQRPEVMEKVKKELAEVVGLNNIVEEVHLPNLRYLNAVIKEIFRLHPALPLLVPRNSGQSCTVGGYTIPKGSRVFLNVWFIHGDPNIWDNPLEFRPERFLNDFRYLPFGSGRRRCPGLPLAERMLYLTLASLLHCFEWESPQGTEHEMSSKFGIVVKKKKPLLLIPRPRLPNVELCTN